MFSEKLYGLAVCLALVILASLACSCASERRLSGIRQGGLRPDLSIPSDADFEKERADLMQRIRVDSVSSESQDGPLIMNAIKDEETGEMVATDINYAFNPGMTCSVEATFTLAYTTDEEEDE